MNWQLQVLKIAITSRLPFGQMLRRLKRRMFGYEPNASNIHSTLASFEHMTAVLKAGGRQFENSTVLEIGSGWFPIVPIMLCLNMAKHVLMSDITPHMDSVTFDATIKFLRNTFPDDQRLNNIHQLADLPISYLSPFSIDQVHDASLDYVISRAVLEHIPPKDIESLLAALRTKMKPNGLMVHIVDHSDHLGHIDNSISRVNFLTWSISRHATINALLKGGENRLRHHEYPAIFERTGFKVISADGQIHQQTLERIPSLRLAEPYANMPFEQLAVLQSTYVLGLAGS